VFDRWRGIFSSFITSAINKIRIITNVFLLLSKNFFVEIRLQLFELSCMQTNKPKAYANICRSSVDVIIWSSKGIRRLLRSILKYSLIHRMSCGRLSVSIHRALGARRLRNNNSLRRRSQSADKIKTRKPSFTLQYRQINSKRRLLLIIKQSCIRVSVATYRQKANLAVPH